MAFFDGGNLPLERLSAVSNEEKFSCDLCKTLRRAESESDLEQLATIPDDSILIYSPTEGRNVVVKFGEGLTQEQKQEILQKAMETDEPMVQKMRDRWDGAGLTHVLPNIEVRFTKLNVEADASVGERGLPSVKNSTLNFFEKALKYTGLKSNATTRLKIVSDASGVLRPGEITLLLGPPGSGKTTLLKTLAGYNRKRARTRPSNLHVAGEVTYNGHTFDEFCVEQSCAYVSQVDVHMAGLTVRETLRFARMCSEGQHLAVPMKMLLEKEAAAGIVPDPTTDAFMKASMLTPETDLFVDAMLNLFGLDVCANTLLGNAMLRGVSGGQKKRVTSSEMAVARKRVLLLDEISTGLDSATTFQIVERLAAFAHNLNGTVLISLLQPPPETYNLFDNVMFMSEGEVVYYGPRNDALSVFESMGFKCPPRIADADYLQEVTSMKDQQRFWAKAELHTYVHAEAFVEAYRKSPPGQAQLEALQAPIDKETGKQSLAYNTYAATNRQVMKANLWRESKLFQRQFAVYMLRFVQITFLSLVAGFLFFRTQLEITLAYGNTLSGFIFYTLTVMFFNSLGEMAMTIQDLPVVFKQRDARFYPGWSMSIPRALFAMPVSLITSVIWTCISYYIIGMAPGAGRFFLFMLFAFLTHATAGALFRLLAVIGRTMVVTTSIGIFVMLLCILASGGTLAYSSMWKFTYWAYWANPLAYLYRGFMVNEYTASRWQVQLRDGSTGQTIGDAILTARGLPTEYYWAWICVGAVIAMFVGMNLLAAVLLTSIPPVYPSPPTVTTEALAELEVRRTGKTTMNLAGQKSCPTVKATSADAAHARQNSGKGGQLQQLASTPTVKESSADAAGTGQKKMEMDVEAGPIEESGALPFTPMSMAFKDVCYHVPAPVKADGQQKGAELQLLHNISGVFSPGTLTALMGASGAGKTTLMDVLAGRKTGGRIAGDVSVGGYPKQQNTFTRISGYVEQTDVHSPQVTVAESLYFSARMRLDRSVDSKTVKKFVDEISDLVELTPLAGALVGLPGVSGLSVEQRKRLTIAVELVANPSIVFLDEPTSGLDARAAAIVMRTVKNIVNTLRTVVCTIHQPSLQIFEAFDELLLLKRGGFTIYHGAIDENSSALISYLEAIPGVAPWASPANPANWMLEVTNTLAETKLGVDFGRIWDESAAKQRVMEHVEHASRPVPDWEELEFTKTYAASFSIQLHMLLLRWWGIYWRSPLYNLLRVVVSAVIALMLGMFYWNRGTDTSTVVSLQNIMGALYVSTLFLGTYNGSTVQPTTNTERSVMYRERAANMYSVLPWVIAQALVELPYITAQATVYSLITYFMIGFIHDAAKFFWFLLYLWLTLLVFTHHGILAVTATPNPPIASLFASVFYALWNLFSGFIVPHPAMPPWLSWCYYLNPLAWCIYGLNVSQLGDSQDVVNIGTPTSPVYITVSKFLEEHFGFEYGFRIWSSLILLGFLAAMYAATAASLRFLNYQKR